MSLAHRSAKPTIILWLNMAVADVLWAQLPRNLSSWLSLVAANYGYRIFGPMSEKIL